MSVAPLLTNNLDNSKQKTSNLLSPAPPPYSWSLLGKSEGPAPPPSSKISWSFDLAWNPDLLSVHPRLAYIPSSWLTGRVLTLYNYIHVQDRGGRPHGADAQHSVTGVLERGSPSGGQHLGQRRPQRPFWQTGEWQPRPLWQTGECLPRPLWQTHWWVTATPPLTNRWVTATLPLTNQWVKATSFWQTGEWQQRHLWQTGE